MVADKVLGFHDDYLKSFSVDVTNLRAVVVIQTHDWVEDPAGDGRGGKVFTCRERGTARIVMDLKEGCECFSAVMDEHLIPGKTIWVVGVKDDTLMIFFGQSELRFVVKDYIVEESFPLKECPLCGGKIVPWRDHDKDLDRTFDCDRCEKCGEIFYFEVVMEAVDKWRKEHENPGPGNV